MSGLKPTLNQCPILNQRPNLKIMSDLKPMSGANPTIASYNASVVNFYNAMGSLARFENKKVYLLLLKTL
jgi:hypothetical protein